MVGIVGAAMGSCSQLWVISQFSHGDHVPGMWEVSIIWCCFAGLEIY